MQKIIHRIFCGFRNEKDQYLSYLENWHKILDDEFEIKLWNKDNLDFGLNSYTKTISKLQDGVFLGDYYRWYLLYTFGGIYLDADIEIINKDGFMKEFNALEKSKDYDCVIGVDSINTGYTSHSIMAKKHSKMCKFMCEIYENIGVLYLRRKEILISPKLAELYFLANNNFTSNDGFCGNIKESIITNQVKILPKDYFSPITYGRNPILDYYTKRTILAHHYAASWVDNKSIFTKHKINMKNNAKMIKDYMEEQSKLSYKIRNLPNFIILKLLLPKNSTRRKFAIKVFKKISSLAIQ